MKIIVKFSPEITIKSRSVRIFFSKILTNNIKLILKKHNQTVLVIRYWDYLELILKHNNYLQVSKILINIPGIHHFLLVQDSIMKSIEDIYHQVMLFYSIKLVGKAFCVRVKRHGHHNFTSQQVERYIGDKIIHNINNTYVNLTKPDVIVSLEIKNNDLFIIIKRYTGLGGLPIGTQQELLSLISGGFDSAVSSYMLIRRGCKVHYCFFNLIGDMHAIEVYKVVYYLWSRFSYSHNVKFISIDFSEVVKEIFSKIHNYYAGIILKRMMIRAASTIAAQLKIKALATGESLGQVSSQTLDNLVLINNVISSNCIILRPIIVYDKESIIKLARQIGTEVLSRVVPEYCGIVLNKSILKSKKKCLNLEESQFNFKILEKSIMQSYMINVNDISQHIINRHFYCVIETKTKLNSEDIILDIRLENIQKQNPLKISADVEIQKIPFYKLLDQFSKLDQNKVYLLYCEQGIMSRLQAIYLYQKGFRNVKIYRP